MIEFNTKNRKIAISLSIVCLLCAYLSPFIIFYAEMLYGELRLPLFDLYMAMMADDYYSIIAIMITPMVVMFWIGYVIDYYSDNIYFVAFTIVLLIVPVVISGLFLLVKNATRKTVFYFVWAFSLYPIILTIIGLLR